jgi:transketolase
MGNALGLAMAERWLAATFNRPGHDVVDHRTYVLASDGDMMEGISSEVASLAGTLRLGRLIVVYDANQVSLSATTDITFSEDVGGRFEACGWHVQRIDGMDVEAVDAALREAGDDDRPSLIVARTHLGYGSPKKQDTFAAHGEPLGADEVRATKRAMGWPEEPPFHVPGEALAVFRSARERGAEQEADWRRRVDAHRHADPDAGTAFALALAGELPRDWEACLPAFTPADGDMATRDAGGKVLNALGGVIPNLLGGSADLDPSTKTALKGFGDFESPQRAAPADGAPKTQGLSGGVRGYAGRNIHFGVREHAMAAAVTGMAVHGGVVPYASTFLTFSDYMRPSIRLAALSKAHVIYVWTHDSLALGEDGPTHQPIEHLASLRAIPGLLLLRPSDATETVEAWRAALTHRAGPVGIVLTRQKLPVLNRTTLAPADGLAKGAYVLTGKESPPQAIVIATGSEVSIALEAHERLAREGILCRVVPMPSWELFEAQPQAYRDEVLPPGVRVRVSVEAGSPFGWERYVGRDGAIIGVNRFGASAPGPVVMREYGFTADHVMAEVKRRLGR